MLSGRFKHDGKAMVPLNYLQLQTKHQIEEKVAKGIYTFEEVPCCICAGSSFQPISEKDRYGLFHPVVICRDCGLIQANPRMPQQCYAQFYDHEYRRLYSGKHMPADHFFDRQHARGTVIYDYLVQHGWRGKDSFVIEIGCAAGGILHCFRENGNRVYGVDLDSAYIDFGRRNYQLDIEVGEIGKLTKLDTSPEIVIYSHVLEHVLNPVADLKKLRPRLTDESLVYVELPGIKNLRRSYNADLLMLLQNAHVYYPSLLTLQRMLAGAGYDFVYGDEVIKSVFRPTAGSQRFDTASNDYEEVMEFLQKLERLHPLLQYCMSAEGKATAILTPVLKKLGLYETARRVYRRFRP